MYKMATKTIIPTIRILTMITDAFQSSSFHISCFSCVVVIGLLLGLVGLCSGVARVISEFTCEVNSGVVLVKGVLDLSLLCEFFDMFSFDTKRMVNVSRLLSLVVISVSTKGVDVIAPGVVCLSTAFILDADVIILTDCIEV